MAYTITKNYPIYTITYPSGRSVSLNLATPNAPVIGVSGRVLNNPVSVLVSGECGLMGYYIAYKYYQRDFFCGWPDEIWGIVERLLNANLLSEQCIMDEKNNWKLFKNINRNWKDFIKWMNYYKTNFTNFNENTAVGQFTNYLFIRERIPAIKNADDYLRISEEADHVFDEFGVPRLSSFLNLEDVIDLYLNKKSFLTILKKMMSNRSLSVMVNAYGQDIPTPMDCLQRYYQIVDQYEHDCRFMDEKMETAGDVLINIMLMRDRAHAKKIADKEAVFKSVQISSLAFEDDNFIAIVPTTFAECQAEGQAMHNCVGAFEWNNYLSRGCRRIVFIRRKNNPTESYISCDMDLRGSIQQYLTKNNRYVEDTDALEFKKKYQTYLFSLDLH